MTRSLWTHLRQCDDCRARYDRAIRLERVIGTGGVQLPSALELELLAPLATAQQPEPQRGSGWWAPRWLAPALSLAVVVALGAVVVWQLRAPTEIWMVRSVGSASLAVRAFCQSGEVIRSLSVDPGPRELRSCPPGSSLAFAVISDQPGHLVAAQWDGGEPLWLLPAGAPHPLEVSTELSPIPIQIELIESQRQVIVSFVRTPDPVPSERVAAWLETWHDAGEVDLPEGVAIVERRIPVEPAHEEGEP